MPASFSGGRIRDGKITMACPVNSNSDIYTDTTSCRVELKSGLVGSVDFMGVNK